LFAMIFLSSIAVLLQNDSLYIQLSVSSKRSKPQLARSVYAAVFMYACTCIFSGYLLFKSNNAALKMKTSTGISTRRVYSD
jgi:hypothetical protein